MPKVIVAGASGLIGHATVRYFLARPGWEVVGLSRRVPADLPPGSVVPLDLHDAAACEAFAATVADATHVVYAALQEAPGLFAGWLDDDLIARNAAMLRNLFEPLLRHARALEHVTLLHGTKAYGLHHPSVDRSRIHIPLREREPRIPHPNFYFEQEDYLRERQRGADWAMTVFRPTVVYGGAPGNNMNPLPVIAAYALLQQAKGEPLHYPGRLMEQSLHEAIDADLVAAAIGWAATAPAARGETFNITNGDVFTWPWVWPAIADELGMEPGEHRPVVLAEELPGHEAAWQALRAERGLRVPLTPVEFTGENSLVYTDMILGAPRPAVPYLNSTIRLRQAGFCDCIDTEDMFRKWFRQLRHEGVLPPR